MSSNTVVNIANTSFDINTIDFHKNSIGASRSAKGSIGNVVQNMAYTKLYNQNRALAVKERLQKKLIAKK